MTSKEHHPIHGRINNLPNNKIKSLHDCLINMGGLKDTKSRGIDRLKGRIATYFFKEFPQSPLTSLEEKLNQPNFGFELPIHTEHNVIILENLENNYEEVKLETDENSKKCSLCNKIFLHEVELKWHTKTVHKNSKKIKCDQITTNDFKNEEYDYENDFQEQIQFKPYFENDGMYCHICGKTFGKRINLKNHIESVHQNIRKYKCNFCSETFKYNDNLRHHVNTFHEEQKKEANKYPCKYCDKSYSKERFMKCHMKEAHKGNF